MNRFTVSLASILPLLLQETTGGIATAQTSGAQLAAATAPTSSAQTAASAIKSAESLSQAYAALHTEVTTEAAAVPAPATKPPLRSEPTAPLPAAPAPGPKPNPYDISDKLRPLLEKAQDLHIQGKTEEARETLTKTDLNLLNAKPTLQCSYHITLGHIQESLGNRVDADSEYRRCLSDAKSLPPAHLRLAQQGAARTSIEKEQAELARLEKNMDYKAMEQVLRQLVGRWPKEVSFQSELAWTLVRAGDGAAAKQVALKTLPLVKRSVKERAVLYNLGRACELLGERDTAIAAYRSALYRAAEGLLVDSIEQELAPEGPQGEIAASLHRLGAFPILPAPQLLEADPASDAGRKKDGEEEYCTTINGQQPAHPFLATKAQAFDALLCSHGGTIDLVVQTSTGKYRKRAYFDQNAGARDDHNLSRVEVKNGLLLVQTTLRRGRWYSLNQEFLTVCAQVPTGVSCAGPVEIYRSTADGRGKDKESFHLGPNVVHFSYRAQLLPGDVLEFTPVKRRKSVDLTGKVKLQFP